MKWKKYAPLMLALALAGCEKVEDAAPAVGNVPSTNVSLTTVGTVSEPVLEDFVTSETAAETAPPDVVEVGGETLSETETLSPETAADEPVGVEGITLSVYSVELQVGQSKMPIVAMFPENASDKSEIWTSSDPAIAAVDGLGNITAVSEGKCAVTVVSAQNPSVSAEVEVTVSATPGLTYFDGILVVNKTYALPADYAPGVNAEAQAAFDEMQADAAIEGLNIYISSGFRSYDYQAGLYQRYVDKDGKAEADRYSARPGHSEHQTGLAFDLNSIDFSFADTAEGEWVSQNCYKYGFIIRYPADKEDVTGYMWEPWHIRYLGKETAKSVYDSGLCLEEYLGITSQYEE
ncbi:MAG: D-alanyl-D-alanine carboxypeptidase family protein [Ruminococcus sp.]|nr:D-alanyl-D-alanine carboxypeptidase family protein [Ruminococcus sp.]MCM1381730.1 D-alanyl-D-alanine carboxypeptidase family protein [Muribaculaceae bacterium]MCM1479700.1 D-alanyl-D-alanine carboxypeptidase family protein [Muribaculaceae bacterium]